jgi:cell division protein FtsA
MATTEFIAAIELGSSKITGVAGRKNSDGSMQILAYTQEDSSSFIHKGVVYNLAKTAQSLTSIINKLEDELKSNIAKVYVGIGGQSLRTVQNVIVRDLDEPATVSQAFVDSIKDENIEIPIADMDILDVVPQEFKLDNFLQAEPVGVACSHIEGRFLNIVARPMVKKNLERSFQEANIEIADLVIAPLATAKYVLTDTERRQGCALVDFGADTTTVSVFKNNILRYLIVLPFGGNAITHDLTTQQIEEEEAERLKLTYGNAMYEEEPSDAPATCSIDDGTRTLELNTINNIIEARLEEIIANVFNQIQMSGYDNSKLLAGIVLTGGGSNMKNIDTAIRKQCKIEKVRIARTGRQSVLCNKDILSNDATQNGAIALLFEGHENCCRTVAPKPKAEEPKPVIQDMFQEDQALKDQEAKAREALKRKEEEERKRKEEEKRKAKEEADKKAKEKKQKGPSLFSRFNKKVADFTSQVFSDDDMK